MKVGRVELVLQIIVQLKGVPHTDTYYSDTVFDTETKDLLLRFYFKLALMTLKSFSLLQYNT